MSIKILTEHCSTPGIETFEVYRKKGGYAAVEKAVKKMTPEEIQAYAKKYCLPLQVVNDLIMQFNSIREISKMKKGQSSIQALTSNSQDTPEE
jgi:hypothetical protein